jgi:Cu+-exporting ATPase
VPVEVGVGDTVAGATVNSGGRLVVRATQVGSGTQLARIAQLVEDAQSGKAEVQRLADRVSGIFVPVVIAVAVATLGVWLGGGFPVTAALTAAVAVLIIACPCALGLATPTALLVGTGRGAQLGILIKGPEVLESTRAVDTVVLDKTGTVTTGRMTLLDVAVADGTTREELLRLAGALEDASEHPVAQAIAKGATQQVGDLPVPESFESVQGLGVQGVVEGHAVVVGRESLLADWSQYLPAHLAEVKAQAEGEGRTVVAVGWDGQARGLLVVADQIKPTSAAAVAQLVALGLTPVLLTGDNRTVAEQVAAAVGITEVVAEVMPQDKADVIARLQAEGKVVAMVGDGVNDAPALAQADLGLAMGTGTDVAIEAADITLVRGDLTSAADAIRLARRTLGTIRANLFWAFGYNVAAQPHARRCGDGVLQRLRRRQQPPPALLHEPGRGPRGARTVPAGGQGAAGRLTGTSVPIAPIDNDERTRYGTRPHARRPHARRAPARRAGRRRPLRRSRTRGGVGPPGPQPARPVGRRDRRVPGDARQHRRQGRRRGEGPVPRLRGPALLVLLGGLRGAVRRGSREVRRSGLI